MSTIDELLDANRALDRFSADAPADPRPSRAVAVVTCMDARLDVLGALGLGLGEAHMVRNAGGVVTDDVIRSLTISQRLLGTREVMLVQHTDCGMQKVDELQLRRKLTAEAGTEPPFEIEAFSDLQESVRRSISRVRESPFLPHRDGVRGFVYDVSNAALREVLVQPPD